MPKQQCELPSDLCEVRVKFPTKERFLVAYSPDIQTACAAHPDKSFFGKAPTLSGLNAAYGQQMAESWLTPQLYDLATFCGAKEKLDERQLTQTAKMIAVEYPYLKVSELLLFFHRMKNGNYGNFYGAVDPMKILAALRTFVKYDRTNAIMMREREEQERRFAEWKTRAVTREQYLAMKQAGEI